MIVSSLVLLCLYIAKNSRVPVSVNIRKRSRNGAWKSISKQQICASLPKRGISAHGKEGLERHSLSGEPR